MSKETNESSVTFFFFVFFLFFFLFSSSVLFFFFLHDSGFFPFAFFFFFLFTSSSSPKVSCFNCLITFRACSDGAIFLSCFSWAICFEKSPGDSIVIVLKAMYSSGTPDLALTRSDNSGSWNRKTYAMNCGWLTLSYCQGLKKNHHSEISITGFSIHP